MGNVEQIEESCIEPVPTSSSNNEEPLQANELREIAVCQSARAAYQRLQRQKSWSLSAEDYDAACSVFAEYDVDGDGKWCSQDLGRFLSQQGIEAGHRTDLQHAIELVSGTNEISMDLEG